MDWTRIGGMASVLGGVPSKELGSSRINDEVGGNLVGYVTRSRGLMLGAGKTESKGPQFETKTSTRHVSFTKRQNFRADVAAQRVSATIVKF